MHLEEFYNYKNKLMEDLLTNETIVRLLDEDIIMSESYKLAYKNVFPAEYIPTTVHDGSTFICFDVDVHSVRNKTFLRPVLHIWVFVHKSKLRLPDGGGVRTDKICSEICKTINGSSEYGVGELDLESSVAFVPIDEYNGKCMTFSTTELNRPHNPNGYIPSKRKG